jgi:4-phospho-D-threonate 3-dehydrogenase / 4-phospho-D-erythronate 3-dehydrogenase
MVKAKAITIGITMGDPSGIGPEIILRSFQHRQLRKSRIIVIGDYRVMLAAHDVLRIKSFKLNRILKVSESQFNEGLLNVLDLHLVNMNELLPGTVQALSGNAAYECIKKAVELALNKDINTIVTAPLNKEALHSAGHKYPGHTEIFASLTGTRDYAMLLHDKKLSVIHVSTHVSLLEAIKGLKRERVEKVIELANDSMKKLCSDEPRIAVAGINPHAGENGLFGNEEIKEIVPAIKNMKGKGINVEGPFPPDTIFMQASNGKYDVVVAMYHDQGHIPLKLLGFNTGVNVTVGLPFIRTSVDHGTAFEIAWQGKANENSMVEAIKLSIKLSQ